MKIGIIGASGQVGLALARCFDKHEVVPIVRNKLSYQRMVAEFPNTLMSDNETAADRKFDVLINAARVRQTPGLDVGVNRDLTRKILNQYSGRLFVQLSSLEVYGVCVDQDTSDVSNVSANTGYGREKIAVEEIVRSNCRGFENSLILRAGNVFGAGLGWTVGAFTSLLDGKAVVPFEGRSPSNAVHVKHLAKMILWFFENLSQNESFAIENANNFPRLTWGEFYQLHASALGACAIQFLNDEESESLAKVVRGTLRSRRGAVFAFSALRSVRFFCDPNVIKSSFFAKNDFFNLIAFLGETRAKNVVGRLKKFAPSSSFDQKDRSIQLLEQPWMFSRELVNSHRADDMVLTSLEDIQQDLNMFARSYLPH